MKYYGKIGGSEQIIVSSTTYQPSSDYIEMIGERPSLNHIADDSGNWLLSTDMLKNEVAQQKQSLLELARNKINDLQIIIDMRNHNPDDDDTREKQLLTAWKQYLVELYNIEQQEGFPENVIWPTMPDEQTT